MRDSLSNNEIFQWARILPWILSLTGCANSYEVAEEHDKFFSYL